MKFPVYITSNNTVIRKSNEYIIIDNNGSKIPCPSHSTSYIVKYGSSKISEQLLDFLSEKGIPVFRFSYGNLYKGMFVPPENNIGKTRLLQYQAYLDPEKRLKLAKRIILASANNKFLLLRKQFYRNKKPGLKKSIDWIKNQIKEIQTAGSIDSLRGVEGSIAREYFSGLSDCIKGFTFKGREYNPPKDEINALLSFCYSLLYSEITAKVREHGLDLFLGFMHEQNDDSAALCYDLSEPFKPMVDMFILGMVNNGELKDFHFNKKADMCMVSTPGKQHILKKWSVLMRKTLRLDKELISHYELIRLEIIKLKHHLEGVSEFEGFRL